MKQVKKTKKAAAPARRPAPKAKAAAARKAPAKKASTMSGFDPVFIEMLAEIVTRLELSEVEVEREGMRIRVAKHLQAVATTQAISVAAPLLQRLPLSWRRRSLLQHLLQPNIPAR